MSVIPTDIQRGQNSGAFNVQNLAGLYTTHSISSQQQDTALERELNLQVQYSFSMFSIWHLVSQIQTSYSGVELNLHLAFLNMKAIRTKDNAMSLSQATTDNSHKDYKKPKRTTKKISQFVCPPEDAGWTSLRNALHVFITKSKTMEKGSVGL